jgi:hypothetical protein
MLADETSWPEGRVISHLLAVFLTQRVGVIVKVFERPRCPRGPGLLPGSGNELRRQWGVNAGLLSNLPICKVTEFPLDPISPHSEYLVVSFLTGGLTGRLGV